MPQTEKLLVRWDTGVAWGLLDLGPCLRQLRKTTSFPAGSNADEVAANGTASCTTGRYRSAKSVVKAGQQLLVEQAALGSRPENVILGTQAATVQL
ncbi:uncharacterized protein LOC111813994 isoform X2 [Octodon degus]|uniref:Uncharacterized protein LOC111813994 isoform X2 n=1 Tax=Octodon degus TaxID=10160 RepID=A0A6P6DQ76_OCTDE|nr:uncharacterized protein LOC111813994 isoform X2 [Octodon degus]